MKKKYPLKEIALELIFAIVVVFGLLIYRCSSEPLDKGEHTEYKAIYLDDERILIPID